MQQNCAYVGDQENAPLLSDVVIEAPEVLVTPRPDLKVMVDLGENIAEAGGGNPADDSGPEPVNVGPHAKRSRKEEESGAPVSEGDGPAVVPAPPVVDQGPLQEAAPAVRPVGSPPVHGGALSANDIQIRGLRSSKSGMTRSQVRLFALLQGRQDALELEQAACFAAPAEPEVRAIPECNTSGVPFCNVGVASTKSLIKDIIGPLMGDSSRDFGWVPHGGYEIRHGSFRADRRWKDHTPMRHPSCGLQIWSPNDNPWKFLDYTLKPTWEDHPFVYKQRLITAGRALTWILRHGGPLTTRQGGYWNGADSGVPITIKDLLATVEWLGEFEVMDDSACVRLVLDIISLEHATNKVVCRLLLRSIAVASLARAIWSWKVAVMPLANSRSRIPLSSIRLEILSVCSSSER